MPAGVQVAGTMNPQQADKIRELLNTSAIWWIGLVVAMIVLAVLVNRLRAWYRGDDGPADTGDKILEQMEELHRQGDLSEEEIRSIKSQFTGRKER